MRGTLVAEPVAPEFDRFIPAHAGNTSCIPQEALDIPVHPRACGEHLSLMVITEWHAGSSPRMRGTRNHRLVERRDHRFIPAHAGNTHVIQRGTAAIPVHPRACGEHTLTTDDAAIAAGSSPRMRGTHFL